MLKWLLSWKTTDEAKTADVAEAFKAVKANDNDVLASLLMAKKISPDAREPSSGYTLLHKAIMSNVHKNNPRGFGVLNRDSLIELLLKNAADPNAIYESKLHHTMTPLHIACRQNMPEIVNMLLAYGANPFICDDKNKKPIDYIDEALSRDRFKDGASRERAKEIQDVLLSMSDKKLSIMKKA